MTEKPVELVWNKGIARLCDRRFPDEFPDGLIYKPVPTLAGARMASDLPTDVIDDPARHADIRKGELVWVRLSWLPAFVRQVLPLVRAPFVLVTADSDSSVPSEVPRDLADEILASPCVIRWFTQNHDGTAPERMAPLPIGIDFHSMAEHPAWGEAIATPSEQEAALHAVERALPPLERRQPQLYIDFAWSRPSQAWFDIARRPSLRVEHYPAPAAARLRQGRRAIVQKLHPRRGVVCQEAPLPRSEMWRRRGQYAAVLSPHGGGLDCHRTWEALALGHLVVVPSSSIDPLFEGLRVVAVSDWDRVDAETLTRWLASPPVDGSGAPITSRHWVERMRAVAAGA